MPWDWQRVSSHVNFCDTHEHASPTDKSKFWKDKLKFIWLLFWSGRGKHDGRSQYKKKIKLPLAIKEVLLPIFRDIFFRQTPIKMFSCAYPKCEWGAQPCHLEDMPQKYLCRERSAGNSSLLCNNQVPWWQNSYLQSY